MLGSGPLRAAPARGDILKLSSPTDGPLEAEFGHRVARLFRLQAVEFDGVFSQHHLRQLHCLSARDLVIIHHSR